MHEQRPPMTYNFEQKPHVLIVQASFNTEICNLLKHGAVAVLDRVGASFDVIEVPGALEIPAAIMFAVKSLDFDAVRRRYDGYVALGCVLKGETLHDEIVGMESARALQDIALRYVLAVGNGILTCNTKDQAMARARQDGQDRGGAAAEACLRMVEIKQQLRLSPKRRWIAK